MLTAAVGIEAEVEGDVRAAIVRDDAATLVGPDAGERIFFFLVGVFRVRNRLNGKESIVRIGNGAPTGHGRKFISRSAKPFR